MADARVCFRNTGGFVYALSAFNSSYLQPLKTKQRWDCEYSQLVVLVEGVGGILKGGTFEAP